MAARKTTKKQSKSDFIRSLPGTMSAADVVAKGKAAGVKFSPQLVYNVRGGAKAKKAPAKKTSAAKRVSAPPKPAVSKAEFVRTRAHLSPKEIVEDARAAGMKLDVAYVYNVRGSSKAKGVVKATPTRVAARRSTERTAPPVVRPITTAAKAEDLLRAVAAEVGLGRAIELLEAERARVHAVLRG